MSTVSFKISAELNWAPGAGKLYVTRHPASPAGPEHYQVEGLTRYNDWVDFDVHTFTEVASQLFSLGFTADEIISLTEGF